MDIDLLNRLTADFLQQIKEVISTASKDSQNGDHELNLLPEVLVPETKAQPKRGRRKSTNCVFKINFSFQTPTFCFEENIDLNKELPKGEGGASNEDCAEISVLDRLQNWSLEKREQCNNASRKLTYNYYEHLPSGVTLRTKQEVIHFLLHGDTPSKKISKKPQGGKTRRKRGRKKAKDSLVEQSITESIVSHGREDILAVAIERLEHSSKARTVKQGVGMKQSFEPFSLHDNLTRMVTREEMEHKQSMFEKNLKVDFTTMSIQQSTSLGLSERNKNAQSSPSHSLVCVSTNRSYVDDDPSREDIETNIPYKCELYIDEIPLRLVAIGKVYKLGSTIHQKTIQDDMLRVVVEQIKDENAEVPIPTEDIKKVGEAPNHFLKWPKRLVKITSVDTESMMEKEVTLERLEVLHDPLEQLRNLVKEMKKNNNVLAIQWEQSICGIEATVPLYITKSDVMEIVKGKHMLNISILQLWIVYLHHFCASMENANIFGFLDPGCIHNTGNMKEEAQSYIAKWMNESKKQCYLVPYLYDAHWQLLVICPAKNIIVCLCSLKKKLNKGMKKLLELAIGLYHILENNQSSSPRNLKIIHPKTHLQLGGYECGYYVMHHMLTIVSKNIVTKWDQIFNNSEPLDKVQLDVIRHDWAQFLLENSTMLHN